MKMRVAAVRLLGFLILWGGLSARGLAQASRPTTQSTTEQKLRDERRQFQDQELITAKPFSFIFNAGDPPRIVWRDLESVRQLGSDGHLRVRWFDADLKESAIPKHPGRWSAWIEGTAPNGTPMRRSLTFYCRPPGFLLYFPPEPNSVAPLPGPIAAEVWREHDAGISKLYQDSLLRSINDTEAGAILIANLSEAKPLGHPATAIDSAAVREDDYNLALKLKVMNLRSRVRGLKPPCERPGGPAPVLHAGSMAEAGMADDAPARIEAVCQQWADDSHEPFATLVARHDVIVLHQAFGTDPATHQPVPLDYRCGVFSITKSMTGILFAQFVDQGLVRLDDSIATVFPDYPNDPAHVPTFRQCFTHTSGFTGHGDWGGARNPHLENILLNGIDANQPGKAYEYSGQGFDLAAKAMEILAGESWRRIYEDHLFRPLGFGDVPMDNASAGAQCTARELGLLAQLFANRGSYGSLQFLSPQTFSKLLPEDLSRRYPGVHESEGIGMHWIQHLRPGRPADSTRPEDQLFSPHTVGHGSLSASIFLIDLDRDLTIVQVRKQAGERYGEWSSKFFQTIVNSVRD
jgi:CubicO group peptidase (beta-lactamase class C family)